MVFAEGATHVKPALVEVPPAVVTLTFPDAPLTPAMAVIVVELTTV